MDSELFARYVVEARHDGSIVVDRVAGEMWALGMPLLQSALAISHLVRVRDGIYLESVIEVSVTGLGLGMSELLRAYGHYVVISHFWG